MEATLLCANEDCQADVTITRGGRTIAGPIPCPDCGAVWQVESSTTHDDGRSEFHPVPGCHDPRD